MKKIVIADNQEITAAGILYLLDKMPEKVQSLQVTNKKQLLEILAGSRDAVVVLDYTLFDIQSIDELLILQQRFEKVRWLLFSEELSENFLRHLLYNTDFTGVVMKDCTLDEIANALEATLASSNYICQRIRTWLQNSPPVFPVEKQLLTPVEKEILKLIALGKTTKEIATTRFSSVHTIITHRKNIFRKLAVNNVHEATKYAVRAGLVDWVEYYI